MTYNANLGSESHLPVAPFYLEAAGKIQYVDLCACLRIGCQLDVTEQHITNDSDWNDVVSKLMTLPLKGVSFRISDSQDTILLTPEQIQLLSQEKLSKFYNLPEKEPKPKEKGCRCM